MATSPTRLRFGVIGLNHNHIFEMTELQAQRMPSNPELALA